MKCIFVGKLEEDAGFIEEVLRGKGYDLVLAGGYDRVENTITPVLESQAEIAVYDLLKLTDSPEELVETIDSIQQSRGGAKIIFLAAGKGKNTPTVRALLQAGYANFVLDSTYSEKKEKFARCLTNYYESNTGRLHRDLEDAGRPRVLRFAAFAGAQRRIGTTTQAIRYAGYLVDHGKKVCYIEANGDGFPETVFDLYQYAARCEGCITYAGIPMYPARSMPEMLKMDYEYFVLDMGDINRESFDGNLFFDERIRRVIVAGIGPQEWPNTRYVRSNPLCRDAAYIISFAADQDMIPASGAFEEPPLFAGYVPDLFARGERDLSDGYRRLFPEQKEREQEIRKGRRRAGRGRNGRRP